MTNKDTRFQKGLSGNRKGRRPGSKNKSSLAAEMLLEGEAERITRACINLALEGNSVALKLCISRLIPVRRERVITLALPPIEGAQDTLRAIGTVLEAVGEGQITPSEGVSVTRLLEAHRAAFEIVELESRLEFVETKVCGAN